VRFRSVADPPHIHLGHLQHGDLDQVADDDLRVSLDDAIASDAGQ
jgi:hypothetical protein